MILGPHQYKYTGGIDEAHRGCIVGNLWVAVVLGPLPESILSIVNDSKQMKEKDRFSAYDLILKSGIKFASDYATPEEIAQYNVWGAEQRAIKRCLEKLGDLKNYLIIMDGKIKPKSGGLAEIRPMVKADGKIPEVSAASIIAKCKGDKDLLGHPEAEKYDWKNNKGYGTKKHIELIKKYGKPSNFRENFKLNLN